MIEIVPVGAMVVTVEFRCGGAPFLSKMDPLKLGNEPRFLAQLLRGQMPLVVDELHDFFAEFNPFIRAVGDAEHDQHVGPAHDAQADLAVGVGHVVNLLERIIVGLDNIVQEMDGVMNRLLQLFPVNRVSLYKHAQIDGAKVAGFVRQQRLLAAGVGGFDLADMRSGVVAVQAIQEDDAGLAVFPGLLDDALEYLAGVQAAADFFIAGIDQVVLFVPFDGLHELFGHADRDVEVVKLFLVGLAHDEIHDIGVIDPENGHVGAAAGAALFDGLCGDVEDAHEGERATGNTGGGADYVIGRTQAGKREAGAAARFMDQSRVLDGIKNLFHRVAHRQDKAGRELTQRPPGVHQGRGVRQKLKVCHHFVEGVRQGSDVGLFVKFLVRSGYCIGHPPEHISRCLKNLAGNVPAQVALFKYGGGVFCQSGDAVLLGFLFHGQSPWVKY